MNSSMTPDQMLAFLASQNQSNNSSNPYQQQQNYSNNNNNNQSHTSPLPPSISSFPPRTGSAQGGGGGPSYPYASSTNPSNAMSDQEAFLAQFSAPGAGQQQQNQQQRPSSGHGMGGGGGASQGGQFGGAVGSDIMKQMEAMQALRARQNSGSSSSPYTSSSSNQFQQQSQQNAMSPSTNPAGSPAALLGGVGGLPANFATSTPQQQQAQLLVLQQQYKLREQQKQRTSSISSGYGGGQMGSIAEGVAGGSTGGGGGEGAQQPGSPSLPQGQGGPSTSNNNNPPTRPTSSLSQHQYSAPTPTNQSQPSPAPSNSNQPPNANSNSNQPPSSSSSGQQQQQQGGKQSQVVGFLKAIAGAASQKGTALPKWFVEGEGIERGRVGTLGLGAGVAPDGGGGGQRIEAFLLWQLVQNAGGVPAAFHPTNLPKMLAALGVPASLTTPTPMIDLNYNPSVPPKTTLNSAEFLYHAYRALVGPFEEMRHKQVQSIKAAQAFALQNGGTLPGPGGGGINGLAGLTKEQYQAYMLHQQALNAGGAGAGGQSNGNGAQQQQQQPNANANSSTPHTPSSSTTPAPPLALPLAPPPSTSNGGPSPSPAPSSNPTNLNLNLNPQGSPPNPSTPSNPPPPSAPGFPSFAMNSETRRMMAGLSHEQQQQLMVQAMRAQAQATQGGGGLGGLMGGLGGGGEGASGKVAETEEERRERKNKKRKVEDTSSAGTSALPSSTPAPLSPASANHRPRNKIQYLPLQRESTTYGGWDVDGIEQDRLRTKASRKPRPVNEFGAVDIEGLLLSLQSRMQGEVSYALTTIEMLSVQPSGLGRDSGGYEGVLPLKNCRDLLEELVELLEEVSIGEGGMAKREEGWKGGRKEKKRLRTTSSEGEENEMVVDVVVAPIPSSSSKPESFEDTRNASSKPRLVHSALVLLGHEGTEKLRSERNEEGVRSTRAAETILVIVNIIRNLSSQTENVTILGQNVPLLHILTAICEPSMAGLTVSLEPLPRPTTTSSSSPPPPFSILDLSNVRKDVLYILSNLAHDIPFSKPTFPLPIVQAVFDIVTSFIFDADGDLYPSTTSTSDPIAAARIPAVVPVYLDLGIAAFSRLTVQDENRLVFGKLPPQDLWDIYTTLVRLLPVTEADFLRSGQEVWTGFNERVCMSIYNLVFLAPSSVKTQIRRKTGYTTILVRILKKFYPNTVLFKENSFAILCRRILETFGVLNEGGEGDGAGVWLDFGTGQGKETEVKKKPRVEMPGWLTGTPGLFEEFFKIKDADAVTFEELDGLMSDL